MRAGIAAGPARPPGARLPALALLLGALLAPFAAAPAQAQTTVDLVSNLTTTTRSRRQGGFIFAQPFTTGTSAASYRLTEVKIGIANDNTATATTVRIRASRPVPAPGLFDPPVVPTDLVATLTRQGSGVLTGTETFTANTYVRLSPGTTYVVTVNEGPAGTSTKLERPWRTTAYTGQTGWSIANYAIGRANEQSAWGRSRNWLVKMAVRGYASDVPHPAAPANLRAEPGDGQVTLSWDTVTKAEGYRYRVWEGTGENERAVTNWVWFSGSHQETSSGVVSGLNNGTTYTFRMHAMASRQHRRYLQWVSGPDSGPVTAAPVGPPPAHCSGRLSGDGHVTGRWSGRYRFGDWIPECYSAKRGDNHAAQYYTFTLGKRSEVTFHLHSADAGTHLYLWEGHNRQGGTPLAEDSGPFWRRNGFSSRIVRTLDAGYYTVEATTFAELEDGSFTLSVDGLVSPVSVVHNGSSLTVEWAEPGGATHYNVVYSGDGARSWARAAWNRAGTSPLTIRCDSRPKHRNRNCVERGKAYVVAVQALDAADGNVVRWLNSDWVKSSPASYAAPAGGGGRGQNAPPAPLTPPVAVSTIRVTHNGSSLAVSWPAPARATHYDVTYWNHDTGINARAAWNRAGTSLTIRCDIRPDYLGQRCVDSGATYTVGVRARNAAGESAWRNSSAVDSGQTVNVSLHRLTVSAGAGLAASEIGFSPDLSPLAAAFAAAPPQAPYADLIGQMHAWRNEPPYASHPAHTDRWDRALLAFGERVAPSSFDIGSGGSGQDEAGLTPMTASEARGYAALGWHRWLAVTEALDAIHTGTHGADTLHGTPGADLLAGLGGDDTLRGLGGDDALRGGDGDDDLTGGAGDDRFVFFSGETGAKLLTDFASGDRIVLKGPSTSFDKLRTGQGIAWPAVADILAGVQAVGSNGYVYSLAPGLSVQTTHRLRAGDFVLEADGSP